MTMASDFLQKKFTYEFRILDIDNDGFLTEADFERVAANLNAVLNFSPGSPESDTIHARYMLWWQGASERDKDGDGRVSLEEWLAYDGEITSTPDLYQVVLQAGADELFKILDIDEDGAISLTDYTVWLGCYGVDSATAEAAFQRLDVSGSGQVSNAETRERVREFYQSENPDSPGNWLLGEI